MEPITRCEIFMAAATGEYDGELPEPQTRVEHWLKKIVERAEKSGDNDFVVNYTSAENDITKITCDKTATEIYEAWKTGKNVKASFPELIGIPLPIIVASQEDDITLIEFGLVEWEDTAFFVGVLHSDNSNRINIVPFQNELVDSVTLNNRLETLTETLTESLSPANIIYIDNGNNIDVEDVEAILSLLQGISKQKNVRCVFEPNAVGEPYLVLNIQSINTVYNSSDQTNTHTIIFSNVLPTAVGVKYVFITQNATTNSTTTELISHTETYEEKILTVQAS